MEWDNSVTLDQMIIMGGCPKTRAAMINGSI